MSSHNARLSAVAVSIICLLANGCATHPDNIAAKAGAPNAQDFSQLDCSALSLRIQAVDQQLSDMYRELASQSNIDALQLAASAVVPVTRIFLDGTLGHKADEEGYARLKGRAISLRRTAIAKQCTGYEGYQQDIAGIEAGDFEFNKHPTEAKPHE